MRTAPVQPRRAYKLELKIEADDLESLIGYLRSFETELYMEKVTRGVSGGYSAGSIYSLDVDPTITHDSWAEANRLYVNWLGEQEQEAREKFATQYPHKV